MSRSDFQYKGNSEIYLQGNEALEPIEDSSSRMTYYVGTPASKILVRDHRERPAQAAEAALNGQDGEVFADVFCQSGWIEIRSRDDQVEIEIYEGRPTNDSLPTLWLGVIDDGKMAVNDIGWEVLKPVSGTQIAFAALVR